jgi:Cellulose binding domain
MSEGRGLSRALRPGAVEMLPWVPTIAGVLVMLGLLAFAVISLRPTGTDLAATPAPPPATPPFLAGPAEPRLDGDRAATPEASPTRPPLPRRTTQPPPAPPLTGRYAVVESFRDSFIGEVRVTNTSASARAWTVRLRFPAGVGGVRAFWVDKARQPRLQRSGDLLTFTSGAPVAAGKAAQLRFQLDRDGSAEKPTTCSVNGAPCG